MSDVCERVEGYIFQSLVRLGDAEVDLVSTTASGKEWAGEAMVRRGVVPTVPGCWKLPEPEVQGWHLPLPGHGLILLISWFCVAHQLRMLFTFLHVEKKFKDYYFVLQENDTQFEFQCL